jgi:hypothetical protein
LKKIKGIKKSPDALKKSLGFLEKRWISTEKIHNARCTNIPSIRMSRAAMALSSVAMSILQ